MLSYIVGWNKTAVFHREHSAFHTKASIIIPVRNEEQNILNCLSSVCKQTYPSANFEIIVVDDHSTDRTFVFAKNLKIPNLKLVRLSEGQTGKKQAITEGIKNSSGHLIITTDADCSMDVNWLSTMVAFYEDQKPKMIVAPVLLKDESGFQQIMQSQETTVLTACACASLYYNSPILCSGANLAYEKEAFISVNGFDGVDNTASGDDVFLMLKMQNKFPGEIKYLRSKDAVVFTHPEKTTSSALSQRKRWASKSFSYGFSRITLAAILIFLTNFLILFSGILSAINIKFVFVFVITFFAKCTVDLMLLYYSSVFFGKRIYHVLFLFSSLIYLLYASVVGLVSPFTNYSWKGRLS
ncbi:MAG: glycosyltransferase [Bacteroidia bacterium]